jgi:hypothetical protein
VKQNANEWGGNIHVLRTEGLAHDAPGMVAVHDIVGGASADAQAAKQCNECFYAVGKGPKCFPSENGTFNCCGDNCFDGSCKCPTTANATEMGEISYSLSYTIKYTLDVAAVKPLLTGVLATPDCAQFYAVEPGAPGEDSETVHESITSFTVPSAKSILLALGHQHTGAINISLFINNKFTCASIPTYGNETGVAGNEKDHLVAMSTCYEHNPADATRPPLALVEGDKITVKAYYYVGEDDTRLSKGLGGIHLNVLSYMYRECGRSECMPNLPVSYYVVFSSPFLPSSRPSTFAVVTSSALPDMSTSVTLIGGLIAAAAAAIPVM